MLRLVSITLNVLALASIVYSAEVKLDLLMPDVSPKTKDTYLCKKFKMDENQAVYISKQNQFIHTRFFFFKLLIF